MTKQERAFAVYLAAFFSVFLIGLTGFALFNWTVDAYGIFGGPSLRGVNVLKPEYDTHLCLGKACAIEAYRPDTIILGSSRANVGLDPQHPGFDQKARVYNAAIDGGNVYLAFRYLQHAHANRPLARVVLGLDFFMFNIWFQNRPDFNEELLAVDKTGTATRTSSKELTAVLLSTSTFWSSIRTVKNQDALPVNVQPYGPLGPRDWHFRESGIRMRGGPRQEFIASERSFIQGTYRGGAAGRFGFVRPGASTLDYFRQIADICRRNGITLDVVILPSHARDNESIRALGLWPLFIEWKRQLMRIVAAANGAAHADAAHGTIAFWDFSGYNAITTEQVPPPGQLTSMKWYYESSHFKKATGDLVLDKILGYRTDDTAPSDFGVRLTPDILEAYIRQVDAGRERWAAAHDDDIEEIRHIASEFPPIRIDQP